MNPNSNLSMSTHKWGAAFENKVKIFYLPKNLELKVFQYYFSLFHISSWVLRFVSSILEEEYIVEHISKRLNVVKYKSENFWESNRS